MGAIKMIIDMARPSCPNCGAELQKTSQYVADETPDDLVLFCFGVCSCDYCSSYQWYEHYGYKGYMGRETIVKK
jgi:uncharacterized protein with PIN domain